MCNHAGAELYDCRSPLSERGVSTRPLCGGCVLSAARAGWRVKPHVHQWEADDMEHDGGGHAVNYFCETDACGERRQGTWEPCDCRADAADARADALREQGVRA